MVNRQIHILLPLLLVLFLVGCEERELTGKSVKQGEISYQQYFPKEGSPALNEFMNYYFKDSRDNKIIDKNDQFVFSSSDVNSDQDKIHYYEYSERELEKFYEPLLASVDTYSVVNDLDMREKFETSVRIPVKDNLSYHLPSVQLEKKNQLKIRTSSNEMRLNLPKIMGEYGLKETDRVNLKLLQSNEDHFVLLIEDQDAKGSKGWNLFITLFIKQDLSKMVISESFYEAIQKKLNEGALDKFLNDLKRIGSTGKYAFLTDKTIIDTKKKKIINIKKEDYLSSDGQYVYINGKEDDLSDGIQKIQTLDNYLAGNEVYEIEYQLDYKEIAKELDFVTSGIGSAYISYFNENDVVLSLQYNGKFVGEAGETNVIIDFQEDREKPTFYLVDLRIMNIIGSTY
ncbi:hypothetical protein ABET41_20095 [Metabacillus fastidiosus]|uniref:Lipoprotein n=1 Tax=Metabacillus fastidiosus TaxID=1458 RepID=A0ABU6NXU6_9BACI|nr:hypothetical protein [Metabacillus fastidiosus]